MFWPTKRLISPLVLTANTLKTTAFVSVFRASARSLSSRSYPAAFGRPFAVATNAARQDASPHNNSSVRNSFRPSSPFAAFRQDRIHRKMSSDAKPTSSSVSIRKSRKVEHFELDVWSIFTPLAIETNAVNLGQGFMNFGPPDFIKEAARNALLETDCNQYSHPKGRLRLRKALAHAYKDLFNGRDLNPNTEIIVTAGANEGIYAILAGFLNEGDEVILMEPFFDQYIANITMNGGVPVYVPLRPRGRPDDIMLSSDWVLDMDELRSKITPRSRIIVLNTPHNPVGKVFSRSELEAIGRIAVEFNLLIISDEVYDRLYFKPHEHERIANLPGLWDRTITVGSGGKTFGATGWRVGWLIGPDELIDTALAAHTRIVFCVNSPLQEAFAVGFETADQYNYFEEQTVLYERRRDQLLRAFDAVGLPYTIPHGSYFVLVNTSRVRVPDDYPFPEVILARAKDFRTCYWMAREIGIVAIPPSEFYSPANRSLAEDYARFAFCKTEETLDAAAEALKKLKDYIV